VLTVGGQAIMCSSTRSAGFGEDEELLSDETLAVVLRLGVFLHSTSGSDGHAAMKSTNHYSTTNNIRESSSVCKSC